MQQNLDTYVCLRCKPDVRTDGLPPPPDQIWVDGQLPEKVTEIIGRGVKAPPSAEASNEMRAWFNQPAFDGDKSWPTLSGCLQAHHLNYWDLYPTTT